MRAALPSLHRGLAALGLLVLAACGGGGDYAAGPPVAAPPADTAAFTATASSATSVALGWQAVDGASGYRVERKAGAAAYATLAELASTQTAYADSGLAADTEYVFRIRTLAADQVSAGVERSVRTPVRVPAPTTGPPSSALIDQALADGTLDAATALLYKAYAEFKDARLPAAYVGNDADIVESDLFQQIGARWSDLSDSGREALMPYLTPPAYVGSWASPRPGIAVAGEMSVAKGSAAEAALRAQTRPYLRCSQPAIDPNWAAVPASNDGHFKVWYDTRRSTGRDQAVTALTALETKIRPALVEGPRALGFKEPLSDADLPGCNGGDGRLDVYLVDMASSGLDARNLGENYPVAVATQQYPAFLLISNALDDDRLRGTLAHEYMHAVQWAYPLGSNMTRYRWLVEATAQWAIDHVYPTLRPSPATGVGSGDFEQSKAPYYLKVTDTPLDDDTNPDLSRTYGSYLFFQFLARTLSPGTMKSIWVAAKDESDPAKAVDVAIPGGFKEQWPKFAKLLWNQDPVDLSSFKDWDAMPLTPTTQTSDGVNPAAAVTLEGQAGATAKLNGNIRKLSIKYYQFRITDPNVRSVAFTNHVFALTPQAGYDISVQAFYRKQGSIWEYEHWSDEGLGEKPKGFCLDVRAERIEDLVIVVSNDSPTVSLTNMPEALWPRLSASNVGCWRWKGSTSVRTRFTRAADGATVDEQADATVTFERLLAPNVPSGVPIGRQNFIVESGSASGQGTYTLAGCTLTQISGAGLLRPADGVMSVKLGLDLGQGGPIDRSATGSGGSNLPVQSSFVCPDGSVPPSGGSTGQAWFDMPPTVNAVVKPDGTMSGSNSTPYNGPAGNGSIQRTWSLTPQRQP